MGLVRKMVRAEKQAAWKRGKKVRATLGRLEPWELKQVELWCRDHPGRMVTPLMIEAIVEGRAR